MKSHSVSDAELIKHIRSVPLEGSQIDNIVADSLPIISFGDFRTAEVLTLGLNPSPNEFPGKLSQDRGLKRLSHKSSTAKLTDLADKNEWSDDEILEIYKASTKYFDYTGVKNDGSPAWVYEPYWPTWFKFPEIALNIAGASYKRLLGKELLGKDESSHNFLSAAHVDISPWATSDVWSRLKKEVQKTLQSHNSEFLTKQLLSPNVKYILALGGAMELLFNNLGSKKSNRSTEKVSSKRVDAKFQLIENLEVPGLGRLPTIYYCSKSPSTQFKSSSNKEVNGKTLNFNLIYPEFGRLIKTHLDTGEWSVNGE